MTRALKNYCEMIGRCANGGWHKLIAEHGTAREAADVADCEEFYVPRGERGMCFMNAALATDGAVGLVYVQGVAAASTSMNIPMEHAWLETEDGQVLDPTWGMDGTAYLGLPIDTDVLWACLKRTGYYGQIDAELIETLRGALA